jgi:hypothetical protein
MKVRDMLMKAFGQFTRDAALGAAIFALLVMVAGGTSSATGGFFSGAEAAALTQRTGASFTAQTLAADGRLEILVILAISFMTLFALNIAFVRHLRRAHVVRDRSTNGTDGTPN